MNDNITFRKPRKRSFSEDNLSMTLSDGSVMNSTLLDDTRRSLPHALDIDSSIILNLKQQLENVTAQLTSAHMEIENLSSDIANLKLQLGEKTKQVETLRKISGDTKPYKDKDKGRTPELKTHTPSYRNISNSRLRTPQVSPLRSIHNDSSLHLTPALTSEMETAKSAMGTSRRMSANVKQIPLPPQKIPHKRELAQPTEDRNLEQPRSEFTKKKKIIILADQRGKNLRNMLHKKLGRNFDVFCFWKPGASLDKILNSIIECHDITVNDYILILGGVNDKNPFEFKMCLSSWLNKVNQTNIVVSEIPYNKHLNELKLNNELRHICSLFHNVSFVNMGYQKSIPNGFSFRYSLCNYFIREICSREGMIKRMSVKEPVVTNYNTVNVSTQTDFCIPDGPKQPPTSHGSYVSSPSDFFRI